MVRLTGTYRTRTIAGESVRAFVPSPLPPVKPPLDLGLLAEPQHAADAAIGRLNVAAQTVPSLEWFLYGFVRKEAVISSQIEGTQATLEDIVEYEATRQSDHPADVEEVCNYVAALEYARRELARPKGLPISARLLCQAHKRLMRGARGAEKQPGIVRTTQNWIGGSRPGNAHFVPPPPEEVSEALAALDRWLHVPDRLPPLVRAGLAHVQFETIHPFLDGNGRIGRLLITLLLEQWKVLETPMLYLSLAFKRRRGEYYQRLSAVRTDGDWEGWCAFFLECVCEAADDGVHAARRLFKLLDHDRGHVLKLRRTTVPAIRLLDLLPGRPMVTLSLVVSLLNVTKPTATKAIEALRQAGVLTEITGKRRDRVYAYQRYLDVLAEGTEL